ncbi:MAG: hypothetical protein AAFX50_18195, partial [Acidobacteriota bacterium]
MRHEAASNPSRPSALPALTLLYILLAAVAVPGFAQTDAAASADASAAEGAEEKPERLGVLAEQADDDGREWLIDDSDGRRYRIERVEKRPGTYRFVSEDRVRFAGGANLEVVEQDEEYLWVKAYEAFTTVKKRPPRPKTGPSDEEKAAAAATYVSEAKPSDRLKLEPFDKGLPKRGQWRNGFDVGDVNGDGHLDIAFGPARKGRPLPNIFLGDG